MSVGNQKSFRRNTIMAALLGCSALYYPLAVDASTLSAKTTWAVSRVASASMGSYCTMAQKYSDDTVLTLAQNIKGEYSLAIDFSDSKFKAGQKQSIGLAVGNGTVKKFPANIQGEKTAVIPLGQDADFVSQLSSAEQLTVSMNDKSSDFSLKQFSAGQKEMGACIEALKTPSSEPTTVAKAEPAAGNEKSKEQSSDVSAENLLAAMPKPSTEITPVEEDAVVPVVPVQPKKAVVDVAEKSDKKDVQKTAVASSEQSSSSSKELAELNRKLDSLSSENEDLKKQLQLAANTKNDKASSQNDSDALKKVQSENAALKQQIADLQNQKKDTKEASSTPSSVDDEVTKLRADNRKLSSDFELLKVQKATLETQVASLQKDVEGKQMKMSGGNWDLEQATRRYQESQREIVRLGALLQAQDVKCANEKKDIEYMLFDPAIATKAQISMLNSLEDQIKEKDEKLKNLETAAAKVQETPEKDAQIAQLQKDIESAKSELSDKTQKLADAENKVKTAAATQADLASKDQSLASVKAELATKTQELADAQSKLKTAQVAQADLAGKDQSLASVKAELAAKVQELTDAQNKIKEISLAQTQMQEQMATEKAKYQQASVEQQSQKEAQLAASVADYQAQLQKANEKIIQLQNQVSETREASLKAASIAPAAASAPVPLQAQAIVPAVSPAAVVASPAMPSQDNLQQASYSAAPVAPVVDAGFKSPSEFSAMLKDAGIQVNGGVQQLKGGDSASYRAYSWKTDSLYGSAEIKKVSDVAAFESNVAQYLSRAKSRCQGDYAAVPAPVKVPNAEKGEAYEIACVGQNSSSTASVLFVYNDKIATTIAHEGRAEAMDLAIDARDKISSKIN